MVLSVFKNSGPGEVTVQFHHWDGNPYITSKKCSLSFLAQVMPAPSSFPAFLLDLSFIFFPAHCISSWNVILNCSCVCLLSVSHEDRSLVCPVYLYIPTAQGSAWNTVGGKNYLPKEWLYSGTLKVYPISSPTNKCTNREDKRKQNLKQQDCSTVIPHSKVYTKKRKGRGIHATTHPLRKA